MKHVVVVGASTAGLAAARTLRELGYGGRLTLVDPELRPPYDRTALSKAVLLGELEPDDIALARTADLAALEATWLPGRAAVALDPPRARVALDDGSELRYDGLVLATGSRPRALPFAALDGVCTLRTLDDALALRDAVQPGTRVVVVGGGLVGLEVAAVAARRGARTTVLEAAPAPLAAVFGVPVGTALAERHRARGTVVRCGVAVEGFTGGDRVTGVRVAGDGVVPADVVVVGVGAQPNTRWAIASGLADRDGVPCDARLATPAGNVVAAGDIVRWPHPCVAGLARVEHFEHAHASGEAAARRLLLGADAVEPYRPQPAFWSHQHDDVIHAAGFPSGRAELELVEGSLDGDAFAVAYRTDGRRVGVMTLNLSRSFRALRRELNAEGAIT